MTLVFCLAALGWAGLLVVPWRPWSTRERLDPSEESLDLADVTVLIPARDEADVVSQTIHGVFSQDSLLKVILIDDGSTDDTASKAKEAAVGAGASDRLTIIAGTPLPFGWAGKLWALEQGRQKAMTGLILLLDADIQLKRGIVAALKTKLQKADLGLVSLMAELRIESLWEKLLVPAFIYYFKLVYPFALANNPRVKLAAAAGGCILIRRDALEKIGGFAALQNAIIDDCTLAQKVKAAGYRTWLGLTHSAVSLRSYTTLSSIWNMVARSAFTQLRYSTALLLLTTAALLFFYWIPVLGLFSGDSLKGLVCAIGLGAMIGSFLPTLNYYRRSPLWALLLPVIATLYLLMTWTSALRYWRGRRAEWKGRVYSVERLSPK
ncbi:MAG: glycosyltransferase [Verrucomicrobiales bacterium]|nr:glycosyltransferase [Verrucomicrobiales bacterium]